MTFRVAVTGAHGFLGWHLTCHARTRDSVEVIGLSRGDLADAERLRQRVAGADAVIHLAGANRGPDPEVAATNLGLAGTVASAVRMTGVPRVVYANSVHADGDTEYGRSKAAAAKVLVEGSGDAAVVNVLLPNLFGEHGRPDYNSFVATFAQRIAVGEMPTILDDRAVELLHAQDAAAILLDQAMSGVAATLRSGGHPTSVTTVAWTLQHQADRYESGVFPDLSSPFEVRLFNQLRSYAQPFNIHGDHPSRFDNPRPLLQHVDDRGGLVEIAKAMGGQSQTFFSTTKPGVTRGNHFHTRKVERFVVVQGEAEITLRRVGSQDRYSFRVSGMEPAVVDIPTLHTHAITNVGDRELLTLFWTDEVFDPAAPDTYPEPVGDVA